MSILDFSKIKKCYNLHGLRISKEKLKKLTEGNLVQTLKLIKSLDKTILIFKNLYKIPFPEIYSYDYQASFIFSRIRDDLKVMIFSFSKNNRLLDTFYQFLNYIHSSILNSEMKLGRLRKFVFRFMNEKENIVESQHKNTKFRPDKKFISEDYRENSNKDIQKINFFKKFFFKTLEYNGSKLLFIQKTKSIVNLKLEIIFYFKKKFCKIQSIQTLSNQLKRLFFDLSIRLREETFYLKGQFSKNLFIGNIEESFGKKESLFQKKYIRKFLIPIKLKQHSLLFLADVSENLCLKILFQSGIFKLQNGLKALVYTRFKEKKTFFHENLNFIRSDRINSKSFVGIKKIVLKNEILLKEKISHSMIPKNSDGKKRYFIIEKFNFYRLHDLYREAIFLWRDNAKKNIIGKKRGLKIKKKALRKQEFMKEFFFKNIKNKILISSMNNKAHLFVSRVQKEVEKKQNLSQKFQELVSMEIDFQIFTDLIKKFNKLGEINK